MKTFPFILAFMFTGVCSVESYACSCIEKKPEDYVNNCDVLFTAILAESRLVKTDGFITTEKGKFSIITHVIKGNPEKEYTIENARLGTSCDSHLMVGEEYVVCTSPGKKLELPACGYTHVLYHGGSEAFLKPLPDKK
jgi:hypothetical protein